MKIVIRIPKEYYNAIKAIPDNQCTFDMLVIKNGKQLPQGHGRLVDADALVKSDCYWETEYEVTNAPTIIEADKGSEDNACLDEGNTR